MAHNTYLTGGLGIGEATTSSGGLLVKGQGVFDQTLLIRGTGTSTYSGGISSAGLRSSSGIESTAGDFLLTGGKIVSTGAGTSTFSGGLSSAGLASSGGLRVSSGDTILAGGLAVTGSSNFTGNVGIGTTSPAQPLSVQGNSYVSGTGFFGGAVTATSTLSVNGNTTLGDASGDSITFNAASWTLANDTAVTLSGGVDGINFDANTLSIDAANDRVGIGTAGPSVKLHVFTASGDDLAYGTNPRLVLQTPTGINGLRIIGDTTPLEIQRLGDTSRTFSVTSDLNLVLAASDATALSTSKDSPIALFTAKYWTGAVSATADQGAIWQKTTDSSGASGLAFAGSGSGGSAHVFIKDDGNVGIGTTSPADKFAVAGNVYSTGIFYGGAGPHRLGGADGTASTDIQLILGRPADAPDPGWTTQAVQVQSNLALWYAGNTNFLSSNVYWDGSQRYVNAVWKAYEITMDSTNLSISAAAAGTAGAAITFTEMMRVNGTTNFQAMIEDETSNIAMCYSGAELSASALRAIGDCTAGGADYAEVYPVEEGIGYGEIVVLGDGSKMIETYDIDEKGSASSAMPLLGRIPEFKRSTAPYEANIIGITSNNYSDFTSTGKNLPESVNKLPVALIGRVPVKVSTESGPIQIGDRITSSSLPGVGMKATQSGVTVGIALEPFDGTSSEVEPPQGGSTSPYPVGKILVFVNLGYSKLDDTISGGRTSSGGSTSQDLATNAWSVDQQSGKVNVGFYGDLNLNGSNIINVSKIIGMWGKWQIDENGKLVATEVETEVLKVKTAAEFGSQEKRIGITIYDEDSGEPYCIKMKAGAMVSAAGACGNQPTTNNQQLTTDNPQPMTATTTDSQTPTSTSQPPIIEDTQSLCSDGIDNDADGLIDLADPDCAAFLTAAPAPETTTASTTASADTITTTP